MSNDQLNLADLKKTSPADLVAMAEDLEIDNASTMRKGELMFSILKERAEDGDFRRRCVGSVARRVRLPALARGKLPARP